MLTVEIFDNVTEVAVRVADSVCQVVSEKPDAVLALPTGATPLPVYRELERRVNSGGINFSRVRVFLLDEYVGLAPHDPRSYRATIRQEATIPLGVPDGNVFGPAGEATDSVRAAEEYDAMITDAGGVDLLLLGVGRNGHIAFNEPGTPFERRTHVTELTEATRVDNASFFNNLDEVPATAITQGPATLLAADKIVVLATGESKAAAVGAALHGPVSPQCPASVVRLHDDVTFMVDRAAAPSPYFSLLED